MDDRRALLAAILANPAEDTPRLVYSDCLDEHGEHDRAEFIRVQVELAALPANKPHRHAKSCELHGLYRTVVKPFFTVLQVCSKCRRRYLPFRETQLHDNLILNARFGTASGWYVTHRPTKFNAYSRAGKRAALLRRGFIERVTCSAADWLEFGDRLRAEHPVTHVTITDRVQLTRHGNGLYGDMISRAFTWDDIRHWCHRHHPGAPPDVPAAILHLRWPGVTFAGRQPVGGE